MTLLAINYYMFQESIQILTIFYFLNTFNKKHNEA